MCFTDQIHTAKQNEIGRNVVLMQQKKRMPSVMLSIPSIYSKSVY